MAKLPLEKRAGQTVEEMACQMEAAKQGNRLYNQASAELKTQQFADALNQQMELLAGVKKNGKIDLDDKLFSALECGKQLAEMETSRD